MENLIQKKTAISIFNIIDEWADGLTNNKSFTSTIGFINNNFHGLKLELMGVALFLLVMTSESKEGSFSDELLDDVHELFYKKINFYSKDIKEIKEQVKFRYSFILQKEKGANIQKYEETKAMIYNPVYLRSKAILELLHRIDTNISSENPFAIQAVTISTVGLTDVFIKIGKEIKKLEEKLENLSDLEEKISGL